MAKAILVIDIPDEYKDYMLKATFTLWKIQDGVLKEIGINGNQFLKQMPEKKDIPPHPDNVSHWEWTKYKYHARGFNDCINEILTEYLSIEKQKEIMAKHNIRLLYDGKCKMTEEEFDELLTMLEENFDKIYESEDE